MSLSGTSHTFGKKETWKNCLPFQKNKLAIMKMEKTENKPCARTDLHQRLKVGNDVEKVTSFFLGTSSEISNLINTI